MLAAGVGLFLGFGGGRKEACFTFGSHTHTRTLTSSSQNVTKQERKTGKRVAAAGGVEWMADAFRPPFPLPLLHFAFAAGVCIVWKRRKQREEMLPPPLLLN